MATQRNKDAARDRNDSGNLNLRFVIFSTSLSGSFPDARKEMKTANEIDRTKAMPARPASRGAENTWRLVGRDNSQIKAMTPSPNEGAARNCNRFCADNMFATELSVVQLCIV